MIVKRYSKDDIDWNIGSLYAHDDFVYKTLRVCKELKEDSKIKYVFGSIPCILQGGRIPPRTANLEDALNIIGDYNKLGVSCRLTFSSTSVIEEELKDDLANRLMTHLDYNNKYFNLRNGVIVSSDLLAEYIKKTYPTIEIIASQVKPTVEVGLGNDTVEYYNNLFNLYDMVVVNPFKINDGEFLEKLENHDRVEFIVNHRCLPNCPMASKHYILQEQVGKEALRSENGECTEETLNSLRELLNGCYDRRKHYPLAGTSFSYSDIEYLISFGFKHFKLEGRDCDGVTFVRDMGDYIFNNHMFSRLSQSILGSAV